MEKLCEFERGAKTKIPKPNGLQQGLCRRSDENPTYCNVTLSDTFNVSSQWREYKFEYMQDFVFYQIYIIQGYSK